MGITENQWSLISHSLGIDIYSAKISEREKDKYLPEEFYRNYFCSGEQDKRFDSLLKDGIVHTWGQYSNVYYGVTDKGIQAFREYFTKEVTQTFKKPSKGRETYMDYLGHEGYDNFHEYLSIQLPKVEFGYDWTNLKDMYRFVSTKYPGVKGENMSTRKEAKSSYKLALKEYRLSLK